MGNSHSYHNDVPASAQKERTFLLPRPLRRGTNKPAPHVSGRRHHGHHARPSHVGASIVAHRAAGGAHAHGHPAWTAGAAHVARTAHDGSASSRTTAIRSGSGRQGSELLRGHGRVREPARATKFALWLLEYVWVLCVSVGGAGWRWAGIFPSIVSTHTRTFPVFI